MDVETQCVSVLMLIFREALIGLREHGLVPCCIIPTMQGLHAFHRQDTLYNMNHLLCAGASDWASLLSHQRQTSVPIHTNGARSSGSTLLRT